MAAGNTPPAFLRKLLATPLLSCLLLLLAPVRAYDLDCANEANAAVAVLSFCNGDGWRRTCLYGGGYSPDYSNKCALVQAGALYCQDCNWKVNMLARCCDIDLSGYEYSSGQQADTHYIEEGIKQLQCPGNFDCGESGYPQCNGGGFDGTTPYWSNEYAYAESYGYCADFTTSGTMLRAMEPRAPHSSGGVKLRDLVERPQLIESSRNGALAGGKTKMSRRLWGSGRPWMSTEEANVEAGNIHALEEDLVARHSRGELSDIEYELMQEGLRARRRRDHPSPRLENVEQATGGTSAWDMAVDGGNSDDEELDGLMSRGVLQGPTRFSTASVGGVQERVHRAAVSRERANVGRRSVARGGNAEEYDSEAMLGVTPIGSMTRDEGIAPNYSFFKFTPDKIVVPRPLEGRYDLSMWVESIEPQLEIAQLKRFINGTTPAPPAHAVAVKFISAIV
ncbi:unnamed protein product [Closterium sp. NIES-53]